MAEKQYVPKINIEEMTQAQVDFAKYVMRQSQKEFGGMPEQP